MAKGLAGRTVNLKVKYRDFRIVTRARSLERPVADKEEFDLGRQLLGALLPPEIPIRLLGLGLSGLGDAASVPAAREPCLPL